MGIGTGLEAGLDWDGLIGLVVRDKVELEVSIIGRVALIGGPIVAKTGGDAGVGVTSPEPSPSKSDPAALSTDTSWPIFLTSKSLARSLVSNSSSSYSLSSNPLPTPTTPNLPPLSLPPSKLVTGVTIASSPPTL